MSFTKIKPDRNGRQSHTLYTISSTNPINDVLLLVAMTSDYHFGDNQSA